jgi:hypothetical protein
MKIIMIYVFALALGVSVATAQEYSARANSLRTVHVEGTVTAPISEV